MTTEWILTYTGRQFWPLEPREEDVCIEDIAHALSLICRFTGHVREFYSVAQHCVMASNLVHRRYALAALLHDASEAYLCDVPRPLKRSADFTAYRNAEHRLETLIYQKFSVDTSELGAIRAVDETLLLTERRDLMPPGHWIINETQCFDDVIYPWSARESEASFLARFKELR